MSERMVSWTQSYLDGVVKMLDEGDEVPTGMVVKQDVDGEGKTTLKEVRIRTELRRR